MLFEDAQDPRLYFVTRIREQACQEGFCLTPVEDEYLSLTGNGNDEAATQLLESQKGRAFEDLDQHISGLAWRAYQQDLTNYSQAKEKYDSAIRALANVDHHPNLGMFVNCIALEKSPEQLNRSSLPWLLIAIAGLFLLVALRSMWQRYFGP